MNEKKITIITWVCLAFIVIAGGLAIWYFQFNVLADKQKELEDLKVEVGKALEKKKAIPGLEKDIATAKLELKDLERRIPFLEREEYDLFANKLDEFRRRAGVTVSRGTWGTPTKPTPVPNRPPPVNQPSTVHKVQYDLAVTGNFYQLIRYMNLLEQEMQAQGRFINLDNFAITKSTDSGGQGPGAANRRDLKITIYSYTYRKPGEPVIEVEEERKGRSTDVPE